MKESEKRLLIAALLVMAVIGALVLTKTLHAWQKTLATRDQALRMEKQETDELLATAGLWKQRGAWLAQHQPVTKSQEAADNELFDTVKQKASAAGVTIISNQHQEAVRTESYQQYAAAFTARGDLPAVFRWIFSLQSPTEFRVVPSLKITPNKEDPAKVDCAVQFWRWYQPAANESS